MEPLEQWRQREQTKCATNVDKLIAVLIAIVEQSVSFQET